MDISVVICTYNRCRSLADSLESVANSRLPDSVEWEVVVVDNNSRDQTRQTVERFCQRYPQRFRYVFESDRACRTRATPAFAKRVVRSLLSPTMTLPWNRLGCRM